jgi:hypothetical protein
MKYLFGSLAILFLLASCGEEGNKDLAKGALVAGGAGGGALLGSQLAPENKILGAVIGGASGGLLGSFLGGKIVEK